MKNLLASAAILAAGATAVSAFEIETMTEEQREIFRQEVRSYLLDHPEVIMEAVDVLEQRQAEAARGADKTLVATNADALFNDANSVIFGNPDGDVTVVEFIDYRCGYCRRAHPEVTQLLESDGNIRLVMKEFPILGPASDLSARFALATRKVAGDEAYREVHEALIALEVDASEPVLKRLGDELGLETDAILAEMQADDISAIIAENRALAQRLNISGTPSFVFGDTMVRGYVPLASMQQIVNQVRTDG